MEKISQRVVEMLGSEEITDMKTQNSKNQLTIPVVIGDVIGEILQSLAIKFGHSVKKASGILEKISNRKRLRKF